MFFTRVGLSFACLFFWCGVVAVIYAVVMGFIAFELPNDMDAQSKWVTREVGEGMILAFMGLALGVLCEISAHMRKPDDLPDLPRAVALAVVFPRSINLLAEISIRFSPCRSVGVARYQAARALFNPHNCAKLNPALLLD